MEDGCEYGNDDQVPSGVVPILRAKSPAEELPRGAPSPVPAPLGEHDTMMTTTSSEAAPKIVPRLPGVAQRGIYPAYGTQDNPEYQCLHMDVLEMLSIRSTNLVPRTIHGTTPTGFSEK